ncbi:MAG: V-type ATPase subunit, partial [Candidatus Micrarchaeota archaeon]
YKAIAGVSKMQHKEAAEVAPFLERYADEKNLSTLLRLVEAKADERTFMKYLVPGGKISAPSWKAMFAMGDISKILEKASPKLPLASAIERYKKTKKISGIEVELSQDSAKRSLRKFRHASLSLGVIVSALLLKEQEVANVRKMVRSKALGLPESEIRSMMVLVK